MRRLDPAHAAFRCDKALRVVWIGTSSHKKGLDIALEACHDARRRGLNTTLSIVGLHASQHGGNRGSEAWVRWCGHLCPPDVDALLLEQDVFLFPTRYEACSMAVLEAMASALPVVGSEVIQWQVESAGVIVSGYDPRDYADALLTLADDNCRRLLAARALERSRTFCWEVAAGAYLRLFNDTTLPADDPVLRHDCSSAPAARADNAHDLSALD
jgi:glycosyltransferase involved in cell wall biosynthesis